MQTWVSILVAVYGGALLAISRKFAASPTVGYDLLN